MACQSVATIYELSRSASTVNEDFFADLQGEVARELRLMEVKEVEARVVAERIEELYRKLHPKDNLHTIKVLLPCSFCYLLMCLGTWINLELSALIGGYYYHQKTSYLASPYDI